MNPTPVACGARRAHNQHMADSIRYCTTRDGAQIAYRVRGAGETLIVAASWEPLTSRLKDVRSQIQETLARHFMLVTYDGRGMGLSRGSNASHSLDERLEDLAAVAEAARAPRFRLVGPVYGSPVAMAFAARNPARVERLLLLGAFADGELFTQGVYAQAVDALRDITVDQWEFASRALAIRGAHPDMPVAALEQRASDLREGWTPEALLAFREAYRRINVTHELANIQAPTLLVHVPVPLNLGPALNQDHARLIVSKIPDARLLSSPASRWDAHPSETIDEILDFLGAQKSGRASTINDPSGVRTVLFTDLVGHTEMMQRLGDERGREVLREHERITRDLLRQHGGAEVKTMGDGFMASFASVTKAMDCAIALQRAFSAHEGEPLQVRVGLNAGEPIEEDGDLFGSTVIMASRIAGKAGAGEILIPEPVRHLLTGKSYVYADRGGTVLKGFEDVVRLYEVRWRE
jgi:class 3 adenylate cyclase